MTALTAGAPYESATARSRRSMPRCIFRRNEKRHYRHQTATYKSPVTTLSHDWQRSVTRIARVPPGRTAKGQARNVQHYAHRVNVVVILAAGGGTRFSGATHKLLAPLHGRPVVQHAVDHAMRSGAGRVMVVTGAIDLGTMPVGVTTLVNERWQRGQATSLTCAVDAIRAQEPEAESIIIGLGDQPFVSSDAWRTVAAAPSEHRVVVASYDGRRGPHPVRLHRSLWAELPQSGDDGARTLIRHHSALVHEVSCPGSAADIDTMEDLQRWTSS